MRLFLGILLLILAASKSVAASNAERINGCMTKALNEDDSIELAIDMLDWKFEFSDYVIRNAGKCFEQITGIPATFESGQGLIFSDENKVLVDQKLGKERQKVLKIKADREARQATLNSLLAKERCMIQKAKSIQSYIDILYEVIENKNQALIDKETKSSCLELYRQNKAEAILNQYCRQVFTSNMHPDLNISAEGVLFEKLDKEFMETAMDLEDTRKSLAAIDPKYQQEKETWERPDLLADAMRDCE